MAEPNRTKIAADWASRGFSCELWTDPPGQRWDDFRHATDELVTVLEGQMEFEVAGHVQRPHVGEKLLDPGWHDPLAAETSAGPSACDGCTGTGGRRAWWESHPGSGHG